MSNLYSVEVEILKDRNNNVTGYLVLERSVLDSHKQYVDNLADVLVLVENILKGGNSHAINLQSL